MEFQIGKYLFNFFKYRTPADTVKNVWVPLREI